MCKIMEEVRQEGYDLGAKANRSQMIDVLLMTNNEDTLLHNEMFKGLRITPDEISASKLRLNAKAF